MRYHQCVMATDAAPIFLGAEIAIMLAFVFVSVSRRGQIAGWLAPALAVLAGIGLVAFLLYAFATAMIST